MTKTTEQTIYQQLKAIAKAHPQLLVRFRTDLANHDRRRLQQTQAGYQYIWGLRECGTEMIPLPKTDLQEELIRGKLIYPDQMLRSQQNNQRWLKALIFDHITHRNVKARLFLITCAASQQGTVRPLDPWKAEELIQPMRWSDISKEMGLNPAIAA